MTSKFTAPAKIIVTGEHSVAHGKLAVVTAINLNCHCTIASTSREFSEEATTNLEFKSHFDQKLVFRNAEIAKLLESYVEISSGAFDPPSKAQIALLADFVSKHTQKKFFLLAGQCFMHVLLSVLSEMVKSGNLINEGFLEKDLTLIMTSEVPLGAGLGSSGAVTSVLAACILDTFGFVSKRENEILSEDELNRVNKLAFAAEHIVHGKPSGIDTLASCFGNSIVFENFGFKNLLEMPALEMLVVNTNQERNTKVLVEIVGQLKKDEPENFQRIISKIDVCSKAIANVLGESSSVRMGDESFYKLSKLIRENHALLQDLRVSTRKLDEVVQLAEKYKCAAKLTGAGGGGCAIVFMNPSADSDTRYKALKEELEALGNEVFNVQAGCEGLRRG